MTTRKDSVELRKVLDSFDDLWSPRIVTQFNEYDVRVAKFKGEYIWHSHEHTDEFFLVIDGSLTIMLREDGVERSVHLPKGATFVVPRGVEHKPVALDGADILMIDPTGTVTVGDRHEEVPDYVAVGTGIHID